MSNNQKRNQVLLGTFLIFIINASAGSLCYFVNCLRHGNGTSDIVFAWILAIITLVIFIGCCFVNDIFGEKYYIFENHNEVKKIAPDEKVKEKEILETPGEVIGMVCGAIIFFLAAAILIKLF